VNGLEKVTAAEKEIKTIDDMEKWVVRDGKGE
jgi:hypothetical protein